MKSGQHTTNYTSTFIAVAEDCSVPLAMVPPKKSPPTAAELQFQMLTDHPYVYTSDEVLFAVYAQKQGLREDQLAVERDRWFSRGQPCFRASPLGKLYGWGIHHDAQSRVALYPLGSEGYRRLEQDPEIVQTRAMRSRR